MSPAGGEDLKAEEMQSFSSSSSERLRKSSVDILPLLITSEIVEVSTKSGKHTISISSMKRKSITTDATQSNCLKVNDINSKPNFVLRYL